MVGDADRRPQRRHPRARVDSSASLYLLSVALLPGWWATQIGDPSADIHAYAWTALRRCTCSVSLTWLLHSNADDQHAGDRRWHHDARESLVYPILPHNWDYLFCLTVGSILCATDPVAVVALLKDLGASPTLTVQIQGEALLNDGTAIVLFRISYNMFKDIIYEPSDVIIKLVWAGMCAIALGVDIGYTFFVWIRMAGNKYGVAMGTCRRGAARNETRDEKTAQCDALETKPEEASRARKGCYGQRGLDH